MLIEAFLFLFVTLVAFYAFLYLESRNTRKSVPEGFPPGPTTLPLFDSLSFSSSNLRKTVEKLRQKFGDIIGLQFGRKNVVIISNYDLIQEAYNNPALCGKHVSEVDAIITEKSNLGKEKVFGERNSTTGSGVIQTDGIEWNNLERKFILKTLRDFGFGPRTIESIIQEDVTELITIFKSSLGTPVNPISWLQYAVFNSLLRFITSETLAQKDYRLHCLWDQFETIMSTENIQLPTIISRFLPPQLSGKKKLEKSVIFVEEFLRRKMTEHKSTLGTNEDGLFRDFMDAYLEEIKETRNIKSPFYGELGELNLVISCLNLIGGSRKTCTTIIWALYHIAKDATIQKKLHEEIDRHIGIYRLPKIKDKLTMPYTEAVMLETFRMSSVAPLGNPHNSTEKTEFHGFTIPEDTLILTNLHDVHHDTKHWEDPNRFRPERFLTPDEREVVKAHRPVIWSTIGKRTSPNELLGSDNFFIFITSIFQRFIISLEESKRLSPGLETIPNFKVILLDRLEFLDRNGKDD